MKVWSKGLESSYRFWVSIARHCYEVFFSTDVNSGRIWIDDGQNLQINTFIGFILFSAHGLLLVKNGAGSARWRNRFTNLSNGVEPP